MNKKIILTVSLSLVCLIVFLCAIKYNEQSVSCQSLKYSQRTQNQADYPSPFINQKSIRTSKGSLSGDLDRGYDLTPFSGVSDDKETLMLIAYLANNPELHDHPLAKIIRNGDKDELQFEGKTIFKAPHIYKYSASSNNTLVFEAVTKSDCPTYKNPSIDYDIENKFFPVSYGEIWIAKPNQEPYKISLQNMNAANPCISSDGTKVAFTANVLDQTNSPVNVFLVVYDLETNETQYFNSPNVEKDHYEITPVMWINNGKTLRTVEDWGETGGHAKIGYIDLD